MNCTGFDKRLNQLLDRRLTPSGDDVLWQHADDCAGCREILVGQEALFDGLDFSEIPELGDDFTQQVVARVALPDRQPARSVTRRQRLFTAIAAVAALWVVAFVPTWRHLHLMTPGPVSTARSDQGKTDDESFPASEPKAESAAVAVAEATDEHVGAQDPLADVAEPEVEEKGWIANAHVLSSIQVNPLLEQFPNVADVPVVRPIASSWSTVITLIWQTLPSGQSHDAKLPATSQFLFSGRLVS